MSTYVKFIHDVWLESPSYSTQIVVRKLCACAKFILCDWAACFVIVAPPWSLQLLCILVCFIPIHWLCDFPVKQW